jgi:hypothetical protein
MLHIAIGSTLATSASPVGVGGPFFAGLLPMSSSPSKTQPAFADEQKKEL